MSLLHLKVNYGQQETKVDGVRSLERRYKSRRWTSNSVTIGRWVPRSTLPRSNTRVKTMRRIWWLCTTRKRFLLYLTTFALTQSQVLICTPNWHSSDHKDAASDGHGGDLRWWYLRTWSDDRVARIRGGQTHWLRRGVIHPLWNHGQSNLPSNTFDATSALNCLWRTHPRLCPWSWRTCVFQPGHVRSCVAQKREVPYAGRHQAEDRGRRRPLCADPNCQLGEYHQRCRFALRRSKEDIRVCSFGVPRRN